MSTKNITRCMMLVLATLMITPVLTGVTQEWADVINPPVRKVGAIF